MLEMDFGEMFTETVSSVLETMFFTIPMGLVEGICEGQAMEAQLKFQGTCSGILNLRISASGARLIAASFLGKDEDSLSEAESEQVICELANMLCGSMVSRLESDRSFDLAAPELVPCGTLESCQGSTAARQSFELERGILSLALSLESA